MDLTLLWYILVILAWALFLALESFDFGVAVLAPMLTPKLRQRGKMLKTIGPVWDANEVWLVVAIGATLAAFADWYAAMLSALYIPMVLILIALAVRGVTLKFRSNKTDARWQRACDRALAWSSLLTIFMLGVVLHELWTGLPIAADGEIGGASRLTYLGQIWSLGSVWTGGILTFAALALGASFLRVKTHSGPRRRIKNAQLMATAGYLVFAVFSGETVWQISAGIFTLATLVAWRMRLTGFVLQLIAFAATIMLMFAQNFPVLLRSTLDQSHSITVDSAQASPIALEVITLGAALTLPIVIIYQSYTYWVFRKAENLDAAEQETSGVTGY